MVWGGGALRCIGDGAGALISAGVDSTLCAFPLAKDALMLSLGGQNNWNVVIGLFRPTGT